MHKSKATAALCHYNSTELQNFGLKVARKLLEAHHSEWLHWVYYFVFLDCPYK